MRLVTCVKVLIALVSGCEVARSAESSAFYYPQTRQETYGKGLRTKHLTGGSTTTLKGQIEIGKEFLLRKLGLDASSLEISHSFQDHRGIVHVYASRLIDGIPVSNHRAQVHLKNGKITSYSASFQEIDQLQLERREVSEELDLKSAIAIVEKKYGIPSLPDFSKTGWIEDPNQQLVKVFFIQLKAPGTWMEVAVDVKDGVYFRVAIKMALKLIL